MKAFLIVLCVILCIIPCIFYGVEIIKAIQMDANCISYLEMAADANSVDIAEKHLSKAVEYLETNRLTAGSTHILVYKPTYDIGLWYENLKSAQTQLQELKQRDNLTELEESNALMKLRETLLSSEGYVTHPSMISFYPGHFGWTLAMALIWLLWLGAFFTGTYMYIEY
jgi:hypothetical protein